MGLQKFLMDEMQRRFSADRAVRGIEKEIRRLTKVLIWDTYKDQIYSSHGLEFELIGVDANLRHDTEDIEGLHNVRVSLIYFCSSKLPKAKRKRLAEVKQRYYDSNYVPDHCSNTKRPLWNKVQFSISIEDVLSNRAKLVAKK